MEQPLDNVLSTSGASSGSADTLIPFANRASVMLKVGVSNSPVWALTPAMQAAAGINVEILMLHKYEENLAKGTRNKKLGMKSAG